MKIKRIFTAVLSLIMVLTMLPSMVFAAGNSDTSTDGSTVSENGLTLTKTATLENDGTYTINLEAYATGTTTTVTEKSGTPLDIVLVIDQSGSMYTSNYLQPMKNAVTSFVNSISDNAKEYNVDHRIAIVGYASNEGDGPSSSGIINGDDDWVNTGLYVNGEFKNYETPGGYTEIYSSQMDQSETYYIISRYGYTEITYNTQQQTWGYYNRWGNWQSITPKTSANDRRNTQVYTYTEGGSLTATDYQNALVSVNTTDGEGNVNVTGSVTTAINNLAASGATRTSYGMEMANQVFANNSIEGTERQWIVVVFTDGKPGFSGYESGEANNAIGKAYTTKQTYDAKVYTIGLYSDAGNDVTNFMNYLSSNYPNAQSTRYHGQPVSESERNYYQTTDDASELENIFTNISHEIQNPSTEVTLDATAVMKDIMGTGFAIPSGYDVSSNVSIQTVEGSTTDNSNYSWGTVTNVTMSPDGINASVSASGDAIEVTGFDYAANYIATGHNGAKIVVQIRGILPTDEAVTNAVISTNNAESGIYASSTSETAALTFPEPQTILTSKAYVLDYAKETALTGLDQNTSVTAIADTMRAVSTADNTVTGTYGNSALSQNSVSYTPKTTNWDGYDNLYVFGKTTSETVTAASANTNGNLWSKVSVIPANNVYYEDDFVTDTTSGTVGIVYTGSWDPDGTSANNGETANNAVHGGWVENDTGLSNDVTYSDGSAQKGTTGATATFTFTGTGVDVYSRTDMTTGTITANLYTGETASKANISKSLIVDNKSASGTYYQIPTVSFNDLEYGTYTVKITVTNAAASDENRVTYYLDGIRVYNPIQDQESDEIVNGAYKDELGAVFTSARDLLQSGSMAFIDEDTNGNSAVGDYTSSEVGKLAPKNEIYLSKDQSITLKVDMTLGNTYYLGLKAPADSATTAEISNGSAKSSLPISHSTDLYYKVTPNSDGTIVVTNAGNNLLSITKLRTTGSGTDGLAVIGQDEALNAIAAFKTASYVEYTEDTLTEDETTGGETAGEGTAGEGTVDEDDIVIENPDDSGSQNEDNQTTEENSGFQSWISNLFNGIKNLFSRW
ncbi:hypothetical protein I6E09_00895 [Mediterraneibacter glycyrrhizinilyticus]|uniref:hypothetical protein n=1 Tax=Mediterraneibacter glycyrrhizinilyticus TaxID=342942 RepID=UPI0026588BC4|nr:hypothetical protein [Mediterraneibacter glycyrrhizinilyticus]MCF2567750.1 hypothetical protein [Mediterraneibacter glycyrrhizinilyticus]